MKPALITALIGVCVVWPPILYWILTLMVIATATLVVCVIAYACGFAYPLDLFADTIEVGKRIQFRKYFNAIKACGCKCLRATQV